MRKSLIIYGAGGAGIEQAAFLKNSKEWKVKGFIDDATDQTEVMGIPVLGKREWLEQHGGNVAIAIHNDPWAKEKIVNDLKKFSKIKFPRVIAPNTYLCDYIEWGEGVVIGTPGSCLCPCLKIGDFVFVNSNTGIGHHTVIGDYAVLCSHIDVGGHTHIGHHTVIGSGVTIRPHTHIGNNSIVGGGSMVVKDVPDNVVVAGVPAKVIKERR